MNWCCDCFDRRLVYEGLYIYYGFYSETCPVRLEFSSMCHAEGFYKRATSRCSYDKVYGIAAPYPMDR